MNYFFLKFLKYLVDSILVVLLLVLGVMILLPFFNIKTYAIISGSMEPNYSVGSMVFVKEVNPESIMIGDVISYKVIDDSETVATHRVIEMDRASGEFQTKGDANSKPDGKPVNFSQLIGKVYFTVPILGYLMYFLSLAVGKIVMVLIILGLLIASRLIEKLQE